MVLLTIPYKRCEYTPPNHLRHALSAAGFNIRRDRSLRLPSQGGTWWMSCCILFVGWSFTRWYCAASVGEMPRRFA